MNDRQAGEQMRERFDQGLHQIRKAIGMRLGGVSAHLPAEGISHPNWRAGDSLPARLPITVAALDAPRVTIEFSSREIHDCWCGIERDDVRRKIGLYANEYERHRTQPGTPAGTGRAI